MSKKKKARDLTTEGAIHRLFPKEIIQEAKREVAEKPKKSRKKRPMKGKGS